MGPGQNFLTWVSSGHFFMLGLGQATSESQLFNFLCLIRFTLTGMPLPLQRVKHSDGSASKIFEPGWVNFLMLGPGQPTLNLENFPQKCQFFSPLGHKNLIGSKKPVSRVGQPLIYCRSKVCSGLVRAHLYSIYSQKGGKLCSVKRASRTNRITSEK